MKTGVGVLYTPYPFINCSTPKLGLLKLFRPHRLHRRRHRKYPSLIETPPPERHPSGSFR